ncbi:MAG: ribosome silencing factor [Planctomycetota bacterium]
MTDDANHETHQQAGRQTPTDTGGDADSGKPTHPVRTAQRDEAVRFAADAARAMADARCTDIVALDLAGRSPVAECLVIGTGTSDRQMRSVADDLAELGEASEHPALRHTSDDRSTWIVVDFGTVVAHIFEPNTRAHYDLELLWGDAAPIPWEREADRRRSHAP